MEVVGDGGAQAQGGEACKGVAQLAPDVQALAAQVHHGHVAVFVFMAVVVAVVFAVATAMQVVAVGVAAFKAVVVAGQAVFGGLAGVGGAQVAALAHPRQAHAAGVGAVEAAQHLAGGFALGRPALADSVVARIARHAFHMHGQVASAAGQREGTCFFTRAGVGAQLGAALVALLRDGGGDLAVEHIDHAAHGAVAVDQGRGAAQHFDLRGQQRLGHHGVVGADGGGVVQLGAVAQHLDARAVHAPDDGAAGTGAKVAAGDAGLAVERLAQRGLAAAHELVAFEHRGGRGHVAGAQLQAAGRHGDGRQARGRGFCGTVLGLGKAGGGQHGGQGHGAQDGGERGCGVLLHGNGCAGCAGAARPASRWPVKRGRANAMAMPRFQAKWASSAYASSASSYQFRSNWIGCGGLKPVSPAPAGAAPGRGTAPHGVAPCPWRARARAA